MKTDQSSSAHPHVSRKPLKFRSPELTATFDSRMEPKGVKFSFNVVLSFVPPPLFLLLLSSHSSASCVALDRGKWLGSVCLVTFAHLGVIVPQRVVTFRRGGQLLCSSLDTSHHSNTQQVKRRHKEERTKVSSSSVRKCAAFQMLQQGVKC